jgi:uncharacterized protein YggE
MAVFTQNFKKALPWAALIFVLIGVIAFQWISAFGPGRGRSVSVMGECSGRVEKDTTAITLRIQTLGATGSESMAKARNAYNVVAAMLGRFKGLEKQTSRWESFEKTEWDGEHQKNVGIQTVISVDISGKSAADIEEVMARAENIEDVYPENLRMFASNEKLRPALEACLNDAVQNARAKAETIAESEDLRVGEMLSAEYARTAGDDAPRPLLMKSFAANDMAAGLLVSDAEFSVSIRATFRIK